MTISTPCALRQNRPAGSTRTSGPVIAVARAVELALSGLLRRARLQRRVPELDAREQDPPHDLGPREVPRRLLRGVAERLLLVGALAQAAEHPQELAGIVTLEHERVVPRERVVLAGAARAGE